MFAQAWIFLKKLAKKKRKNQLFQETNKRNTYYFSPIKKPLHLYFTENFQSLSLEAGTCELIGR